MRRPTIKDDDELDRALAAYGKEHGLTGSPEEVAQATFRELLMGQGGLIPFRLFRITPIEHDDDGPTDVSINLDKYSVDLADWEPGDPR